MPWKMEGEHVVLKDGNPVWIFADGKEEGAEFEKALTKISALNTENKTHREAKEAAEGKLKEYDAVLGADSGGLDGAKKALETVRGLNDKKLIEAGEAQKIRDDAVAAFKVELANKAAEIEKLNGTMDDLVIGHAFAGSKVVQEKLTVPHDWAKAVLGAHFKNENGKAIGYLNGQPIRSLGKNLGEVADFDEALESLLATHPQKDKLYKSDGASGSGAPSGGGKSNANGGKTMPRSQFTQLPPAQQMEFSKGGGVLTEG
jgi:hypothetical protein